jgi:hypothetical protein
MFRKITTVYSENCKKHINTLCGQNAELLNTKVGGTCKLPLCFKGMRLEGLLQILSSYQLPKKCVLNKKKQTTLEQFKKLNYWHYYRAL